MAPDEGLLARCARPKEPSPQPCMRSFLSRGKFAWCLAPEARRGSARGPLLPVETLAAQNVAGQTLVKAEAAGGGGRRPAFTRVWPATTNEAFFSLAKGPQSVRMAGVGRAVLWCRRCTRRSPHLSGPPW